MAIVRWKLRKVADGYEGMIILPLPLAAGVRAGMPLTLSQHVQAMRPALTQKPIAVKAKGKSAAGALASAAGMAMNLAENPLLQAVMPPGTAAAVATIKAIAASEAGGKILEVADKLIGPGGKRLKKTLKKLKFW